MAYTQGAYIQWHISGGLISGGLYRGLIAGGLITRGSYPVAYIVGTYIRGL